MIFIVCIVRLGYCAPQNKDDVNNTTSNPRIDQSKGIETYSAAEMCSNYSQLIYKYINDSRQVVSEEANVDDKKATPREFSHMALLGHRNDTWYCSGSLISNRWILSAAHCKELGNTMLVRWARLGDLNYLSETDDARPMDYQIDQIVVHPDYRIPSLYNDIALFHLDRDVEFSSHVRPICLNADPNWQSGSSKTVIATGWGLIQNGEAMSLDLLKVNLDIISADLCKSNYASISKKMLMHGIVEDSMICAGDVGGEKDNCGVIGGSPLQIVHANYTYTQVGFLSAGKGTCPEKDSPDIYTKVSKFLPWIEQIVWPKSG